MTLRSSWTKRGDNIASGMGYRSGAGLGYHNAYVASARTSAAGRTKTC